MAKGLDFVKSLFVRDSLCCPVKFDGRIAHTYANEAWIGKKAEVLPIPNRVGA